MKYGRHTGQFHLLVSHGRVSKVLKRLSRSSI